VTSTTGHSSDRIFGFRQQYISRDKYGTTNLKMTDKYTWHPVGYVRQRVNVVPRDMLWFLENKFEKRVSYKDWEDPTCTYPADHVFMLEKRP
jgi:hypothetical protein